jgi:hypothetical protein
MTIPGITLNARAPITLPEMKFEAPAPRHVTLPEMKVDAPQRMTLPTMYLKQNAPTAGNGTISEPQRQADKQIDMAAKRFGISRETLINRANKIDKLQAIERPVAGTNGKFEIKPFSAESKKILKATPGIEPGELLPSPNMKPAGYDVPEGRPFMTPGGREEIDQTGKLNEDIV